MELDNGKCLYHFFKSHGCVWKQLCYSFYFQKIPIQVIFYKFKLHFIVRISLTLPAIIWPSLMCSSTSKWIPSKSLAVTTFEASKK